MRDVLCCASQALDMHKAMYRGKLRDCLLDNKIDVEDSTALARTARLLCLTPEQVGEIDAELKGAVVQALSLIHI